MWFRVWPARALYFRIFVSQGGTGENRVILDEIFKFLKSGKNERVLIKTEKEYDTSEGKTRNTDRQAWDEKARGGEGGRGEGGEEIGMTITFRVASFFARGNGNNDIVN